jgi:ribosomal protein L37AE/L43A
MIMATYLDYASRDGDRPERWPNLREAASKPWMGQTAVIGRRPWLVVGFDGEMYELENEFGDRMATNKFEVLGYESDNNRLVAASRIKGSPLDVGMRLAACDCAIGPIDFNRETYEWSVLNDEGNVVDVESTVAALEDADWKVAETVKEAVGYDPASYGEGLTDLHANQYYCPECGAPDVDFGSDIAYCENCGWHGSQDEILTDHDRAHDRAEVAPSQHYEDDDWQYSSVHEAAPADYSGKDDPGHPKHMEGAPDKVSEIYNACMREDRGRGSTLEDKKSSCAAIAWSTYKKEKKSRTLGAEKGVRVAKIVQENGEFCVKSEDGKKNLGCSDTMEGAKKRLREVEYFKHQGALALIDLDLFDKEADQSGVSDRLDNPKDGPLKCPACGSHTVQHLNSEDSEFGCLACGKRFKHDVIKNPKAPKDRKGSIEIVMDSNGSPITSGQYYNLHGDKYKIPDVIKVLEINHEGHIVATVDDNPTPLKISAEDIESNGYSFEPLPISSHIEAHFGDGFYEPIETNAKVADVQDTDQTFNEYTLPTPSGGMLWIRENSTGNVTGWSLPSFDGQPGTWSNRDLDRVQSQVDSARQVAASKISKTAGHNYTENEQKSLIEEKGTARNKDKLRLEDSHYIESNIEDDLDFLF